MVKEFTVADQSVDIVRTTLGVLLIGAMIGVSLWVVKPFLPSLAWAAMTVIATWPLMLSLENKLWRSRGIAAAVMTGLFLLVFVLPASVAIGTVVDKADVIVNWMNSFRTVATHSAPDWLTGLPYVGRKLAARWDAIAAVTPEELSARLLPHAGTLLRWLAGQVGNVGALLLHFVMTLAITVVLYMKGDSIADGVRSLARRIAGIRGEESVLLAAHAVRAVAMGVVVSSLALAVFSWAGLAATGIPYAVLLAASIFMLNLLQIGPVPVLAPAVFWLYWRGEPAWGTVLLIWTLLALAINQFLGSLLIKKSANISLLIILPGVIGGLIALGFIGIFIGPVVLAVAQTLLTAWVETGKTGMPEHAASAAGADE